MNKIVYATFIVALVSCGKKIRETNDQVYSRHLQHAVPLTVISTPIPENKSSLNLIIFNDGQDFGELGIRKTIDSLWNKHLIKPLVVVGISAGNRTREYGVAGKPDYQQRGDRADKYAQFVVNELYPFIKKKSGVRSFNQVIIAGCSQGGLSAFDIAWNNANRFNKVGVFSGSFWWRDKDANDPEYSDSLNRIMIAQIRSSRKRPDLKMWFYVGDQEEKADRDQDGVIDAVDDTRDLIQVLKTKKSISSSDIQFVESSVGRHDYTAWRKHLPEFLIWAVGKD